VVKITDKRTQISDLISPRRDIKRPIYNWHAFKHSYSKDLVDVFIDEFGLKKNAWVMDPFCGGGTTLLASKHAGLNADGFDILPFSVYLSNVKTGDYDVAQLKKIKRMIESEKLPENFSISLPKIGIAEKAFSANVAIELFKIKQAINLIESKASQDIFNLAFLSILESVSKTAKAGGFLRMVDRRTRPEKVLALFLNKVQSMIQDIEASSQNNLKKKLRVAAYEGDARKIPSTKLYDAIITSPPYPNRHDYTRIYALEMFFDFIKDNNELKKIRYNTLRSHVEARERYEATDYEQSTRLKNLIKKIKHNGVNNIQVLEMLEGYFEDMFLVMGQMKKRLKKNGKIALVVSNVRFAGVNLPVDQLLAEIGEQVGLTTKGVWLARYRGNSSQQMDKYERKRSRESVVIWENR
jgi:tRNA G10  N-methylase Trm11